MWNHQQSYSSIIATEKIPSQGSIEVSMALKYSELMKSMTIIGNGNFFAILWFTPQYQDAMPRKLKLTSQRFRLGGRREKAKWGHMCFEWFSGILPKTIRYIWKSYTFNPISSWFKMIQGDIHTCCISTGTITSRCLLRIPKAHQQLCKTR